MDSHQTILALKYAHGGYSLLLLLAFCCQGWNGLRVRSARLNKAGPAPAAAKAHRLWGSALAVLCPIGFLMGFSTAALDKGVLEYPLHLFTGLLLIAFLAAAYGSSRKIQGGASPQRNVHAILGIIVLGLYAIQSFIGIGVLM